MWIAIEDTAHESVETSIIPDFVSFNVFHCGVPVRISSLVKIRYTWITRIYYCPIDKQPIVMSHLIKSIALERPTDNENSLSIVVCWNSCPVMFDHRTTRLWWEALVSALQQTLTPVLWTAPTQDINETSMNYQVSVTAKYKLL